MSSSVIKAIKISSNCRSKGIVNFWLQLIKHLPSNTESKLYQVIKLGWRLQHFGKRAIDKQKIFWHFLCDGSFNYSWGGTSYSLSFLSIKYKRKVFIPLSVLKNKPTVGLQLPFSKRQFICIRAFLLIRSLKSDKRVNFPRVSVYALASLCHTLVFKRLLIIFVPKLYSAKQYRLNVHFGFF